MHFVNYHNFFLYYNAGRQYCVNKKIKKTHAGFVQKRQFQADIRAGNEKRTCEITRGVYNQSEKILPKTNRR